MRRSITITLAMIAAVAFATPADAAEWSVTFTYLSDPAPRNSDATASVHTKAGARCDIDVIYSSGESSASGLQNKTGNSSGNVSWTWRIGPSTHRGYYPVRVTCSKNGVSHQKTKQIHIT